MISRSKQNKNNCQRDFSSPVPEKIQQVLLDLFNLPSSTDRWDHAVYNSGVLMHHYLNDCPAARNWLRAGTGGKLRNIVMKRNNNLKRD